MLEIFRILTTIMTFDRFPTNENVLMFLLVNKVFPNEIIRASESLVIGSI